MKKFSAVMIVLSCFIMVGIAYGSPFTPPVVTITGQEVQWTEGALVVPFTLEGRDCTVFLAVYTKDLTGTYGRVDNGLGDITRTVALEYHTVVGIDTCIFVSSGEPFTTGNRTITWDGKDKVGRQIEPGEYTYYLLACDEENPPIPFAQTGEPGANFNDEPGVFQPNGFVRDAHQNWTQYETLAGGKLDNPRIWSGYQTGFSYWEYGQDTGSAVIADPCHILVVTLAAGVIMIIEIITIHVSPDEPVLIFKRIERDT